MKRYSQNIKDLNLARQKVLDNLSQKVYTYRTGLKKMITKDDINEIPLMGLSKDFQQSDYNNRRLSEIYGVVKDITMKEYGFTPVIAGGAVRDTLLGLPFRDIDFFFTDTPEENFDDFLVYVTELLREKDTCLGMMSRPALPLGRSPYQQRLGFTAYELLSDRGGVLEFMVGKEQSVPELLGGFYADIVRCYYDGTYHATKSFAEALKAKRIPTKDYRTYDKLQNWKERTGFKITIGRPPAEKQPKTTTDQPPHGDLVWKSARLEDYPVWRNPAVEIPPPLWAQPIQENF